jgi:palmitoyltransferase ZDHHC9/14/18
MSVSLIFFPSVVMWAVAAPHPVAAAIGYLWMIVVLYFLLRCAFSDPGIGRRQPAEAAAEHDRRRGNLALAGETHPQRNVEEIVEFVHPQSGQLTQIRLERKWCYTCNLLRPLRASHCTYCDCCVERMDHHCPWTGTCIGARNYRFFFAFVTSTSLYAIYTAAMMALRMGLDVRNAPGSGTDAFADGLGRSYYLSLIMLIYSLLILCMVGGLSTYHCSLVASNMTTHEDMRRMFRYNGSPYDAGGCQANCNTVLCVPVPRSQFDDPVNGALVMPQHDPVAVVSQSTDEVPMIVTSGGGASGGVPIPSIEQPKSLAEIQLMEMAQYNASQQQQPGQQYQQSQSQQHSYSTSPQQAAHLGRVEPGSHMGATSGGVLDGTPGGPRGGGGFGTPSLYRQSGPVTPIGDSELAVRKAS